MCDSIETANNIIENNRNELKRLFNNKFLSDFIDDAGFHEFENEYGEDIANAKQKALEYKESLKEKVSEARN